MIFYSIAPREDLDNGRFQYTAKLHFRELADLVTWVIHNPDHEFLKDYTVYKTEDIKLYVDTLKKVAELTK